MRRKRMKKENRGKEKKNKRIHDVIIIRKIKHI